MDRLGQAWGGKVTVRTSDVDFERGEPCLVRGGVSAVLHGHVVDAAQGRHPCHQLELDG